MLLVHSTCYTKARAQSPYPGETENASGNGTLVEVTNSTFSAVGSMVQSQVSLVPLYGVPFSDRRIPPPRPESTLHKITGQCSVLRTPYALAGRTLEYIKCRLHIQPGLQDCECDNMK